MLSAVKRIFIGTTALAVAMASGIFTASVQAEEPPVDLGIKASSVILMEATTGQILYEYNADNALPPASMAKMMTEYLVMEAIENKQLTWEEELTTSQYAADVIGSGNLLAYGEKATVRSLFEAMSIYSANDASVVLAERLGGTEEGFAKMMNQKARELGLSEQAHFINATGLSRADLGKYAPKELQGETLLSAKDAAIIARRIIIDHPEVLEFTKIPRKKFRESDTTLMENWNWMLEANKTITNYKRYAYDGLDGLKTGHTKEAGYCFTGTAERNGMRLISVVMGTANEPSRFLETAKVLDYGFNSFEMKQVIAPKTEVEALKTVNVKKGVKTTIPVVTETGISFIVKKGTPDDQFQITAAEAAEDQRIAPITEGQVLGKVTVTYDGVQQSANLVAAEETDKGSWFRLFFRAIKNFFVDLFTGGE